MKKSDFTGWREVFAFTFAQSVKQKSYVIFIVLFSVVALLSSTAMTLVSEYQDRKEEKAAIKEMYVFDGTGLVIDYSFALSDKKYKNVKIVSKPEKNYESFEQDMKENKLDDAMLVKITYEEENSNFHVLFVQSKELNISEIEKQTISESFCDFFEEAKMKAVDISKEQIDYIEQKITREVKVLTAEGEILKKEADDVISLQDYMIILGLLMVCMLLTTMSGNQIALSIVTEKSTRVLEYLVLNVRPMALIVGKILATLVTTTLQMVTVGFCYMASPMINSMISPVLCKWLFGLEENTQAASNLVDENMAATLQMVHGIKMEYVFLALLFMLLGIVLYGIIAGLSGASVSKMDEMQEAMILFQALLVVGCYADMILCVLQISGVANPNIMRALSICPVTAPFLVPANMLLGKMSWWLIIASFLTMIISVALLFMLTAKVYGALIFYNGKALKPKDIIALAFPKTVKGKEEIKDEK